MPKKTKHQEIMDKLKEIDKKLIGQSSFGWYVLGIAIMISGVPIVISGFHYEGIVLVILGVVIWAVASIFTQKLKKQ